MEVVTDRLPPIDIPEGRLFCQPSRIANIYKASIEEVVQPRDTIAAETVKLSIAHRRTLPYPQILQVGPGAKARTMLESALRGSTAHLGERLVYDARHIDNNNMAHLIQHHMSALGYIKQKLGHGKNDVTVLLDTKPPALALKVFAELGYEIHCTNRSVSANVVTVEIGEFFQLLPYVRSVEVSGWLTDTPGKIFVSRRESRRLINENEVEALLREHGFEKVYFEDIPLMLQWSMMRNASDVAAIHGAALGCLALHDKVANGRGFRLFEMFGPGFVADCFRKYAAVLGGEWVGCRGRLTPAVVRDIDEARNFKKYAYDDFVLDAHAVRMAVQSLQLAPQKQFVKSGVIEQ